MIDVVKELDMKYTADFVVVWDKRSIKNKQQWHAPQCSLGPCHYRSNTRWYDYFYHIYDIWFSYKKKPHRMGQCVP